MPLYEFQDTRTGKTVDMFLPIERRDDVPSHLKRITVPQRVAVFGTSSDPKEPGVASTTVPKAFRELELSGSDVHKIEKETQFSRDHIRRVWNFLWLLFGLLCFSAQAGDFTPGYSFLLNDSVTAAKLNALMGSGSINSSFIHGQTLGAPGAADEVVFWLSPSGPFRRASLTTLLLGNTNLIIAQSEDTSPAMADYLLTYDVSAGTLAKITLGTIYTNASLLLTNFAVNSAPTNGDTFAVFDRTNGVIKQMTLVSADAYFNRGFTSATVPITNAAAVALINVAHGFSSAPKSLRAVLVCTNASAGFAINDEVDTSVFGDSPNTKPVFAFGANATNVFASLTTGLNAMLVPNKTSGAQSSTGLTNWNLKLYARP